MAGYTSDQVYELVKRYGPLLPVKIASLLKMSTTFAGAFLSELIAKKSIRCSHAKIGGSPLYYTEDQREKLQDLYGHLNDKDQNAFTLLKEKKILRDIELSPIMRVALRNIKDFAVPLNVTLPTGKEIFWKWYLINNEEVSSLIKDLLYPAQIMPSVPEHKSDMQPDILEEQHKNSVKTKSTEVLMDNSLEKKQETLVKVLDKSTTSFRKKKQPEQTIISLDNGLNKDEQPVIYDEFLDIIKEFFSKKDITISEFSIVKKNSEIDMIIDVPSVIGRLNYFCKAKSKKRSNESDISSAFVRGKLKNLPTLYLSDGELTKKAQKMLENEFNSQIIARRIA